MLRLCSNETFYQQENIFYRGNFQFILKAVPAFKDFPTKSAAGRET